jgi:cysteine-rich repeat protein
MRSRAARVAPWAALIVAFLSGPRPASAQGNPGTPLFQFFAFYAEDLEIGPGPVTSLHGRIHTNGDLYLNSNGSTLSIGDDPAAGIAFVEVSAGGRILRGTKYASQCQGIVRVDAFQDVAPPAGDLDPLAVPCFGSVTRVVPAAELAAWQGTMVDSRPYGVLPGPDVVARFGSYWERADLRIVLRVEETPPHAIVVERADGSVDPELTATLAAFTADEAWNRGDVPGQGPSTLPGTAPVFYTDVPLATPGCGCAPGTPVCNHADPLCYVPPFGPPLPAVPPSEADTTRVYGRSTFDGDPRRGGFYNQRERKWMLLLDVNVADLVRWNAEHGSPFFSNTDATDGGLVLFLGVAGPDADGVNNYGARVFGSANLPLPGGIDAGGDPTGLTVVSDQALYVLGDFNRGPVEAGDLPRQPAALIGDSINVLSSRYWNAACAGTACRDGQSPLALTTVARDAAATRINAALVGGVDRTLPGNSNGGLENFPRMHEDWSGGVQLRFRGSLASFGRPQHASGPWCGTGLACNIYNPPSRDWDFEPAFLRWFNLPPMTPQLSCGNGTVEPGEACDDGNLALGDCCGAACDAEAAGAPCADDGSPCSTDACDGAGLCAHAAANAGLECRSAADECDVAEQCTGSSPACPADLGLPDGDGDSLCDAVDPCTNVAGGRTLVPTNPVPKIVVNRINTETMPGNDHLNVVGAFFLPAGKSFADLDPLTDGARIVLRNRLGGTELDVTLPGGAYGGSGTRGWKRVNQGKTWTWDDTTGNPPGAIVTVHFYDRNATAPRRVEVSVTGDDGTYPVVQGDEPIDAIVTLGGQAEAAAGLCTESAFVPADCSWNANRNQLTCKK